MSSVIQNPEAERRERKFAAEQGAIAATTTKAIAVRDERPAVDRYLDEVAPASIVGRLIKFKKGKFVIADDESEIADSEDFICLADMTMIGWVKFNKDADRKSTRLNSSHLGISYAVFCLKKKK